MSQPTWISFLARFGLAAGCFVSIGCSGPSDTVDASADTATADASDAAMDTAMNDAPADVDRPLPDLTISTQFLRENYQFTMQYFAPNACEIGEQCVGAPGWRRLLMFTTYTPNVGTADLNLGMSSASNPNFEYSDCHHHYHFRGYADYSLLRQDGTQAAIGHKQSFCVEDLVQDDTSTPGVRTQPYYNSCGEAGDRQGISMGWADDYYPNLPCQWIDVTDVPAGQYTLRVALNTEHRFEELDYSNNSADVTVTVPDNWTAVNPLHPCSSTGQYQGVGRDCGWTMEGSHDCTPGAMVSVGCNAQCGLGSCQGAWDLRICEGNTPCQGGDAMHLLQQDSGACGTGVFNLDSTCPMATFQCPASGRYTVLSAADFDGDTDSSCTLAFR